MFDSLAARDQRVFRPSLASRVAMLLLMPAMLIIRLVDAWVREDLQAFALSDARAAVSYLALFFSLWFCGRVWVAILRPPTFIVTSEALRIEQGKRVSELRWSQIRGFAIRSGGRLTLFLQSAPPLTFKLLPQQLLVVTAALSSCLQKQPELRYDGARSVGAWLDLVGLVLLAFLGTRGAAADHPYGLLSWGLGAAVLFLVLRRSSKQAETGFLADSLTISLMASVLGPSFLTQSLPTSPWWSAVCGLLMAFMTALGALTFGLMAPRAVTKPAHPG